MKRIPLRQPPFHLPRCADKQIQRKRRRDLPAYPHGLAVLVPRRHDDQDVHIAVGVRRAVGVGAEQNDLVGVEALDDLAREAADQAHGDVGPTIPARGRSRRRGAAFGGHALIVPGAGMDGVNGGTERISLAQRREERKEKSLCALRVFARDSSFKKAAPVPATRVLRERV